MSKKTSIITVAAMISTAFVGVSLPANALTNDGSCDLSSGDGSSGLPYLLYTEQDLFEMPDCVDSTTSNNFFKLSNSIHVNSPWTPVNLSSNINDGAGFDGDNHTVSGINASSANESGLFANVNRAEIKDLYLEVGDISGSFAGSLAGYVASGSSITNVHVRASGDISSTGDAGGVFGAVSDAAVQISNVSFVSSGTVSSAGFRAGGIAGLLSVDSANGLSAITEVSGGRAGGIAGTFITDPNPSTVSGFSFRGTVNGENAAGGLFGEFFNSGATVNLQNASVIGTVESTNQEPGGFIGDLVGGNTAKINTLNMSTSFASIETKSGGATTTSASLISPYATGVTIGAPSGVFYDTDKATYAQVNSSTGKTTAQLKTLIQFQGATFGIVELSGYPGNAASGDKWVIDSGLNDGFPVLRSAYDNNLYGAPIRPANLRLTPGAESFSLSFSEPIFNGGSAVTGYQYSTDSGSNWSNLTSTNSSGTVSGEIGSLDADTLYSVTVRAANTFGESPASVAAISKPASATSTSKTWAESDFTTASSSLQTVSAADTTSGSKSYLEWTLTDDQESRAGAVWSKSRIDFGEDFDLTSEVYLGDGTAGADGMAFVLQTSSSASLSEGGGIGYSGINPVFAVEFDTYDNGTGDDHANGNDDYWSLKKNANPLNDSHKSNLSGVVPSNDVDGDGSVETTAKEFTNPFDGELEDDNWRTFRVTWDASTQEFNAYFDFNGDGDTYDIYERLQLTNAGLIGDSSLFGTTPIYWGFTASTGGATNLQKVRFEQALRLTETKTSNSAPVITNPGNQSFSPSDVAQTVDVSLSDDATTQSQWSTALANSDDAAATVTGTLTSATNLRLTITPVADGSTNVSLSVTDADGLSATVSFSISIGSSPTPYTGPIITDINEARSPVTAIGQTATVNGSRLSGVTKAIIDGKEAEIISVSEGSFQIVIPDGVSPGTYDLQIESSIGNLTYLDAVTIAGSSFYGEVSAWTVRISDTQAKVYVKYPTIGEKIRISHQAGGSGSYETVFVKTLDSESDESLTVNIHGSYIVRTIDLEDINRIRVTVGDERVVQVRYNR